MKETIFDSKMNVMKNNIMIFYKDRQHCTFAAILLKRD